MNDIDPILGISKGRPSALYRFLTNAFLPGVSQRDTIRRFDVVITHNQVPPRTDTRSLHILDIGSGPCLLLRSLLDQHSSPDDHSTLLPAAGRARGARLQYTAFDKSFHERDLLWTKLVSQCQNRSCCFLRPTLRTFDVHNTDILQDQLTRFGPFSLIIVNNVLHELQPALIPTLLGQFSSSLEDNGRLILIDPDPTWCFSAEAWRVGADGMPAVEWEAEAVWYSKFFIGTALTHLGLAVNITPTNRGWEAVGIRQNVLAAGGVAEENIRSLLRSYLTEQHKLELERGRELRRRVQELLKTHNEVQGELHDRVMELAAICISTFRCAEALGEIPNGQ